MKKLRFTDLFVLCGLGAAAYGFWLAWRPLGFILGGAAVAGLGILYERGAASSRRRS
jgi:hypothetical protein